MSARSVASHTRTLRNRDHAASGGRRDESYRLPIKFSATPGETGQSAPVLGERTREVLSEADYAAEEIDTLFSSGAAHGC